MPSGNLTAIAWDINKRFNQNSLIDGFTHYLVVLNLHFQDKPLLFHHYISIKLRIYILGIISLTNRRVVGDTLTPLASISFVPIHSFLESLIDGFLLPSSFFIS